MKTLFRLCVAFALGSILEGAADNSSVIAAVLVADEARMTAMKAGDAAGLDAIFSDELRYAHSSGVVDSKASFKEALVARKTVYEKFDYKERTILPAGPGVAIMSGRVLIDLRNASGPLTVDINYLAVWREEGGKWRFLAWQSCRNPPAAAKP
jgi:hypothetical protein